MLQPWGFLWHELSLCLVLDLHTFLCHLAVLRVHKAWGAMQRRVWQRKILLDQMHSGLLPAVAPGLT